MENDNNFKFQSPLEKMTASIGDTIKLSGEQQDSSETGDIALTEEQKEKARIEKEAADTAAKQASNKPKSPLDKILADKAASETNEEEEGDKDNESDDDSESAVASLYKQYGYTDEDKEYFKDVDFTSNDLSEIKKFNDLRDSVVKNQGINDLFEAYPIAKELIQHLYDGKSLDTWKEKQNLVDWSKTTLTKENVDEQERVVRENLKQQGASVKIIETAINALKDSDELFAEAAEALKQLDNRTKGSVQAKELVEQKAAQVAKQEQENAIKQIKGIIKTGKVGNYQIPESEKKDIENWIFSGARDKMYEEFTIEESLLSDIINKKIKEGKLSDLKFGTAINNAIGTKTVTFKTKQTNPLTNSGGDAGDKKLSLSEVGEFYRRNKI